MSDHYVIEKMAYSKIAEYRAEQERARLAERAERTRGRVGQTEHTFARLSFRGVLRMLALKPS